MKVTRRSLLADYMLTVMQRILGARLMNVRSTGHIDYACEAYRMARDSMFKTMRVQAWMEAPNLAAAEAIEAVPIADDIAAMIDQCEVRILTFNKAERTP